MLKSILFIPDSHIPYQDPVAFSLVMKVVKAVQPDVLVILGDFADFYQVSDHLKHPSRWESFDSEVQQCKKLLRKLELYAPDSRRYYIMGNHEYRLDRYLAKNAPDLNPYISVNQLLELDVNLWQIVQYKEDIHIGPLWITHDVGESGIHSTRKAGISYQDNVIIGHNHRLDYHVSGNAKGTPHIAASFGWLGDVSKIDYMHKLKARTHWSHGFGWGRWDTINNRMYITPVPIIEGTCCVEGKIYK